MEWDFIRWPTFHIFFQCPTAIIPPVYIEFALFLQIQGFRLVPVRSLQGDATIYCRCVYKGEPKKVGRIQVNADECFTMS